MPLDQTHQHSVLDIMSTADPHTPISGSVPTLAEVLVAGADTGETAITMPMGHINGTTANAEFDVVAANGTGGGDGQTMLISGGDGDTGGAGGWGVYGAGHGGAAGDGGRAKLAGGNGDAGNGGGGAIVVGGEGKGDGTGGIVTAMAGTAGPGSGKAGGDIVVSPGAGDGAGRNGLVFLNLPTSDPGVSGALYNLAGVVKVSA